MNWGYRVTFLYIGFASMIALLVIGSINQKIDLVTSDYYAKELVYQDKLESIKRNNELTVPVGIYWNSEGIRIEYPADFNPENITGSIQIFRPSDNNLDFTVDVAPGPDRVQIIPGDKLTKGMYRINLDYNYNNLAY